tara:strand:- start:3581 stop:3745 length:165 start_codon:yes stop_codon:yes gene_type:complete
MLCSNQLSYVATDNIDLFICIKIPARSVAIIALFVKFELALKALHRAPLPAFKR